MAFNAGDNMSSKLSMGLLNFILAVSSGWALKHYSHDRYALAGYGLFFAHSVSCILRYTHPNPGQMQRSLCEHSLRYSPAIFVTLIIAQMQTIVGDIKLMDGDTKWLHIILTLYAALLVLAIIRQCCSEKSTVGQVMNKLVRLSHKFCVLWNFYGLWRIAMMDEYWWSLGLGMLLLLNHFVLWRLTLRFNITPLEVDTVGMCFSVIFAINASQELLEYNR